MVSGARASEQFLKVSGEKAVKVAVAIIESGGKWKFNDKNNQVVGFRVTYTDCSAIIEQIPFLLQSQICALYIGRPC